MGIMLVYIGVLIPFIITASGGSINQTEIVQYNSIDNRIILGETASLGQIPWQISIVADRKNLCGGSIITNRNALTAAHCCYGYTNFELGMGTIIFDLKNFARTTQDCIVHKRYIPNKLRHDIALIGFEPIIFTKYIQPISLPRGAERFWSYVNARVTTSGWGKQRNGNRAKYLKWINATIISNYECAQHIVNVFPTTLCAVANGIRSVCSGDSGGPLTLKAKRGNILLGVTSFVSRFGCDQGYPFGFNRVSMYIDWIEKNIKKDAKK